jgi:hypothetical protein
MRVCGKSFNPNFALVNFTKTNAVTAKAFVIS